MSRLTFYYSISRSANHGPLVRGKLAQKVIAVQGVSSHHKQCTNLSYVTITLTGLMYNTHTYTPPPHTHTHKSIKIPERCLTLRRLMSYIYGAPILDVSRSHTTTQHSR